MVSGNHITGNILYDIYKKVSLNLFAVSISNLQRVENTAIYLSKFREFLHSFRLIYHKICLIYLFSIVNKKYFRLISQKTSYCYTVFATRIKAPNRTEEQYLFQKPSIFMLKYTTLFELSRKYLPNRSSGSKSSRNILMFNIASSGS